MWKWYIRIWKDDHILWSGVWDTREMAMKRLCSQRFIDAARRLGGTGWDFANEQLLFTA